jgi:hypothetical protein
MAAAFLLFILWLWLASDVAEFIHRVFVVAGEIGRSRLSLDTIIRAITFEVVLNRYQIDLLAVVAGAAGLFVASNPWGPLWRDIVPASVCSLLIPWFRSFAQVVTLNEWQNSFAFVGLSVCLGIGILLKLSDRMLSLQRSNERLSQPYAGVARVCLMVVVGAWAAGVMLMEVRTSWRRTVQQFGQFGPRAEFRDTVDVPGLRRLRWGDPTKINATTTVERVDFERVASYLAQRRVPFFVMGDSTVFYGVIGMLAPQPLLYFLPSHSFLNREIPDLDRIIIKSLERHGVSVVVREKNTYLPEVASSYKSFPLIWGWFTRGFRQVAEFGNYEIWERKVEANAGSR